ncbi:MAG TPA: MerR family transcriptional regulator [Gaiellaceae bacterium]|nr:MerR family transcriptional regulator [Gaiellaceae bacterium]
MDGTRFRIGELSRRSGVSPELLRAWERRYGLLRPVRSAGGLRLYSREDAERVRLMREHLSGGVAAAEAAALVSGAYSAGIEQTADLAALRTELAAALDAFDEAQAQAVLDRALAAATLDSVLTELVVPYLHELGERWAQGQASVAQEHFASAVTRGRLLGLARGWGRGLGPLALLACLPGERHDLGLLCFGVALHGRGWRVVYLGADTPLPTVDEAAASLTPALVVLVAVAPERVVDAAPALRRLGERQRVALAGAGATETDPQAVGVLLLTGDPVAEAERVTRLHAAGWTS